VQLSELQTKYLIREEGILYWVWAIDQNPIVSLILYSFAMSDATIVDVYQYSKRSL
jgi:hypothetical protein